MMYVRAFMATLAVVVWTLCSGCLGESPTVSWDMSRPNKAVTYYWNSPYDPYMVQFRTQYRLDDLVAFSLTDLDRVRNVCNWVHRQWEHSSDQPPERNDPLAILEKAQG